MGSSIPDEDLYAVGFYNPGPQARLKSISFQWYDPGQISLWLYSGSESDCHACEPIIGQGPLGQLLDQLPVGTFGGVWGWQTVEFETLHEIPANSCFYVVWQVHDYMGRPRVLGDYGHSPSFSWIWNAELGAWKCFPGYEYMVEACLDYEPYFSEPDSDNVDPEAGNLPLVPGDIVDLPLMLENQYPVSALEIELFFDDTYLEVVEVQPTVRSAWMDLVYTLQAPNNLLIALYSTPVHPYIDSAPQGFVCGEGSEGNLTILTVSFMIKIGAPRGECTDIFYGDVVLTGLPDWNGHPKEFLCLNSRNKGQICFGACALGGILTDASDMTPLSNATVEVWPSYPCGSVVASDESAINGYYCIPEMNPSDRYDVRAYASGYCSRLIEHQFIPTIGFEEVDIQLSPLPEVVVTDQDCDFWSTQAILKGCPVQTGDVIVTQDPDGVICGVCTVSDPGTYLVSVYGDDTGTPEDEGAEEGDLISFYLNCTHNCPDIINEAVWISGGIVRYDIQFDCVTCDSIHLNADWNLISFKVSPADSTVESVVGPIMENVVVVRGFDVLGLEHGQGADGALTYDPGLPPAFSSLKWMGCEYGYWVKVTEACTLVVCGDECLCGEFMALNREWNLIGYLSEEPNRVWAALERWLGVDGLYSTEWDGAYRVVRGYDQKGLEHGQGADGGLTFDPTLPEPFSTLKCMMPGFGYWIKLYADAAGSTLVYPCWGETCPSGDFVAEARGFRGDSILTFSPTSQWVDFYGRAELNGEPVQAGDVVTAYDSDGIHCGSVVIHTEGCYGLMPVYGDDETTPEVDEGAHVGDRLTFYINGQIARSVSGVEPEWKGDGEMVEVDLEVTRLSADIGNRFHVPTEYGLLQNYPNPFNPTTTIHYQIPDSRSQKQDTGHTTRDNDRESSLASCLLPLVSLKIYNILGQEIVTLVDEPKEPGYYAVTWDGRDAVGRDVGSGVYFYRLKAGEITLSRKLVLVK